MGSPSGYECSYRFRMDDEIVPDEDKTISGIGYDFLILLWEFRTNFTLINRKPINVNDDVHVSDDDRDTMIMIMGSESRRFGTSCDRSDLPENPSNSQSRCEDTIAGFTRDRLKDYSIIPDDVITKLSEEGFDFSRQLALDPQNASLFVIPVVIELDVCTVQKEGEPLDDVMDRAIRPQRLGSSDGWIAGQQVSEDIWCFLKNDLSRVTVEDVDEGLRLMDKCPICWNGANVGTQICLLPLCGHAFHLHCVLGWLIKTNLCPYCHQQVHDFTISDPGSDYESRSNPGSDIDAYTDADAVATSSCDVPPTQ